MALAIGILVLRVALQITIVVAGPGDTFWWFVRHASRGARTVSEIPICTPTEAGRNLARIAGATWPSRPLGSAPSGTLVASAARVGTIRSARLRREVKNEGIRP